jgi:alpha-methylacyl-CoA racemase
MVDGAAGLLTMVVGFQRAGIWSDKRGDNIVDGGAPYYAVYETSDGRYVSIGAMEDKFYALLVDKLGLANDVRMKPHTDRSLWDYQRETFSACFRKKTRDQWCTILEGSDTCFAPVLSMAEAHEHPHLKARRTYATLHGVNQPAPNPRFGVTQPTSEIPPAVSGEHTRSVLGRWGFSDGAIDELLHQRVVVQRTVDTAEG